MKAQHTLKYWARQAMRRALPEGAYEHLDRSRRWRHYRRARVVFVHVPKAAGSSIALALYGRRLGHHAARELMREDPSGWAALEKFAMVREPVARFRSAYAFVLSAGTQEGAVRWRDEYDEPGYRDVNVFVRDYLARGNLLDKDVVFWPQSHFVCDAAGRPVTGLRLFTTERFDRLGPYLSTLGIAAPARVNRGRPDPGLDLDIGPDARRMLESLYAADLAWYRPLETGA